RSDENDVALPTNRGRKLRQKWINRQGTHVPFRSKCRPCSFVNTCRWRRLRRCASVGTRRVSLRWTTTTISEVSLRVRVLRTNRCFYSGGGATLSLGTRVLPASL